MFFFFFFNDTATTEIYTLSLHDALPISFRRVTQERAAASQLHRYGPRGSLHFCAARKGAERSDRAGRRDRKSTRLNSSHGYISYAVFCLKKKKKLKEENNAEVEWEGYRH